MKTFAMIILLVLVSGCTALDSFKGKAYGEVASLRDRYCDEFSDAQRREWREGVNAEGNPENSFVINCGE